jgi:hypothetical protein
MPKTKGDPVLLSGDVKYKMDDLLKRRRNSALTGQHRETQRYDKEIMLLRAALGMPPKPPEEIVRTQRLAKDPVNGENLAISSENDVPWMRKTTIKNLAKLQDKLYNLGYDYKMEKGANIDRHIWNGFKNGKTDNFVVMTIGRDWTISAERNGKRLDLFSFNKQETADKKGIPSTIATENWDGKLQDYIRQQYAHDWVYMLRNF